MKKHLYIISGCNGAGKTTACEVLLPEVFRIETFLNADIMAAIINPKSPESVALQAGRKMLVEIEKALEDNLDFVIETTLATKSYVNLIKKAQGADYEVVLIYFWLADTDMAIKRVARRVEKGGHNIPDEVIERRYKNGLKNLLNLFIPLVDKWLLFDNSDYTDGHPRRIAERLPNGSVIIEDTEIWEKIKQYENH